MAQINQYLDTIRNATGGEQVRDAIIQALDKIHGDNPVQVTERTATMPSDGSDLEINAEGGIAYDHIVVHPASGSGSGVTKLTELEATENKEYVPDEGEYYSKVTVDVPQLNCDIMEDIYEVTENNTTIYAAEEGFDGFSAIHINVSNVPVSGSFKVQFYDTDRVTLLDQQLVPAYGSATYGGPYIPVDPSGKTFVGWNPVPYNIIKDTKCYPNFVSQQMVPGEIADGWDTIVADGGAHYPIGSYKSLYYSATFKNEEIEAFGFNTGSASDKTITFSTIMRKVAEGEDGSRSTWLSLPTTMAFNQNWVSDWSAGKYYKWPDRWERKWMQCLYTKFSPIFLQHIKPVVKYTQGSVSNDPPFEILTTQDALWMTAIKEVCIDNAYWENDLSVNLHYDQPFDHAKAKAKYYDGLPLCIAYMNQAGLTPKQRDELFYFDSSQYYEMTPSMRDVGDHYLDRRIGFGTSGNKATYTNPETGEQESARYLADRGTPSWASGGWIFGFCLI